MKNTNSTTASILYAVSGLIWGINCFLFPEQEHVSVVQYQIAAFNVAVACIVAYLIPAYSGMKWVLLVFTIIGLPLTVISLPVIYSLSITAFTLTLIASVSQSVATVILFLPKKRSNYSI
ncbi:hypothetical protein DJ568_04905 [Mucilaginibacter hurinus]|uniref:EamA domain-containing protein n=1 Tax=Mucilaginibacter hurinus TaxID=2201324 RepID=A0A367GRK9_9SPHI|nr:hypothetical protein DJ568_04905 [Mucilaginibacter hurinus]